MPPSIATLEQRLLFTSAKSGNVSLLRGGGGLACRG